MPDTSERIGILEYKSEIQQKQIDENTDDIKELKDFKYIVEGLTTTIADMKDTVVDIKETTTQQGKNIDKMSISNNEVVREILNMIKGITETTENINKETKEKINKVSEITEEIKLSQARIETKQQYYWADSLAGIFKRIPWKKIGTIIVSSGIIGAIAAYLNSVLHIFG